MITVATAMLTMTARPFHDVPHFATRSRTSAPL